MTPREAQQKARDQELKYQYEKLRDKSNRDEREQALFCIMNGYWIQQDANGPRGIAARDKRPFEAVAMEGMLYLYDKNKAYYTCLSKNGCDESKWGTICRTSADTGLPADMIMTQQERDRASQDFIAGLRQQIDKEGFNFLPILKGVGIFGLLMMLMASVILYIKNR